MSKKTDWLPSKRNERLAMAEQWGEYIAEKNEVFKIPQPTLTKLSQAAAAAKITLAVPESARNAISNAQLKVAFDELAAIMRDIKKRYFHVPPLNDVDFAALQLKPKDTVPTNVPPPSAAVDGILYFPMPAIVEIRKIRPFGGALVDLSTHGVRIHYGVMGAPDESDRYRMTKRPNTGNDLPHSVFTRKRTYRFTFAGDSGKEVFFCMRYENSKGETGPWGTMLSAFIP